MSVNGRIGGPGRRSTAPGKGFVAGLLGGVAGCLAMAAVQVAWSRAFGPRTRPAEDDVAGDAAPGAGPVPSTVRGARALARGVAGREPPARHARAAGRAFHFAFGVGLGGAYGVLVEYVGIASAGSGVPFGALQVLLADELAVPALGLSGPPSRAPTAAHLGSLAAHAAYGLATEWVRRRVRARL